MPRPTSEGKHRMLAVGITPALCRASRTALGLKQQDVADKAGVSRPVVQDFERRGRMPIENNLKAIRAALEAAGITFHKIEGGRVGFTFLDEDAT